MVVIVIRRCVRPEREAEFLREYESDRPVDNPAFEGETLVKEYQGPLQPLLKNFPVTCDKGITYLNIAHWRSVADFENQFPPQGNWVSENECCERKRLVFDIVSEYKRTT